MPLCRCQCRDNRFWINVDADVGEDAARLRFDLAPVDERTTPHSHATGEHILGHGKLLEHLDFLRHIADPGGAGVIRRPKADALTGQRHVSAKRPGWIDTVEDFDQRGLAGTILAQQGMNLGAPDVEIDAA